MDSDEYTKDELIFLLKECCGHPHLKSGGQKLTHMKRLRKEVEAIIKGMQHTMDKVKNDKNWTPEKFSVIATKQHEEIEKIVR